MHRNDIDGLRAIAVLSVVLFHLGFAPRALGGGFVGVDVFFVISGYLITGILQSELDAGRFSLLEFYHRRVRRIFPALFVVYACCLAASAYLFFPSEAREVGRDVLWSLGFLSNVRFAHADGYFNQASKTAPLLHTWSLSVEEQFYIGLPLLLWALRRARKWLRLAIIAALSLLSFVIAQHFLAVDARQAFYLVHCRAWELLAGSMLALGALPWIERRWVLEIIGTLGLGLIALAVVRIDGTTPFPGYWALAPCLGTVAILYSGAHARTWTARLLGVAPLRWVGLISYSLYLWHWPLIALYFARNEEMSARERWAILALSLVLAVLSYRFVERPFRTKPYRFRARGSLAIAAASMAAVVALAYGAPVAANRLHPTAKQAEVALSFLSYRVDNHAGTCFLHSGFNDVALYRKDLCLTIDPKRRNFLVMGDSHAAHFMPAFEALHPEIHFMQATASGCQAARHDRGAKRCTDLFSYVYDEYLPAHRVDAVLLAGRWPVSSLAALEETVKYLRPLVGRVIVFGPIVEYNKPFPTLLARSITENNPELLPSSLVHGQRVAAERYAAALPRTGADYYSIYDATCPRQECTVWAAPGVPMQFDQHHLTLSGSELVLSRLGPSVFR